MSEALDAVESRWERSVPLPKIDAAMLAAHLAPWPELRGRAWTVLGGGLRSLNLRCDERVLRIGSELGKEAALLRLAAELGVRVPRVLDESPTALLLEFVPHEPLPATEAAGRKVAEAAVRIHGHRFEHAGMLGADLRVSEPFAGRLDGLLAWAQGLLSGIAGERLGAERRAALLRQAGVAAIPAVAGDDVTEGGEDSARQANVLLVQNGTKRFWDAALAQVLPHAQ